MVRNRLAALGAAAIGLLAVLAPRAGAQCITYNFEEFGDEVQLTGQLPGVSFSTVNGCSPPYIPRVNQVPAGTTSSGTKTLLARTSCQEFGTERLVLTFDVLESGVFFNVGTEGGFSGVTVRARAFNAVSGGTQVDFDEVVTGPGVRTAMQLGTVGGVENIRRVEIEAVGGFFEAIDDLRFGFDFTPPIARIDTPTFLSCVCDGVSIIGEACDPDGAYGFDRLEYRPVDTEEWTEVGSFTTPFCGGGQLYFFDAVGLADGFYDLRLTVQNACGLQSTDFAVVYVDRAASPPDVRTPIDGECVGGSVCFDGTASDRCFEMYSIDYVDADGNLVNITDSLSPVINDPMGIWDTSDLNDGFYEVQVSVLDICGNFAVTELGVTIDNTAAIAEITSPMPCQSVGDLVTITGTASDAKLRNWILEYSQPGTPGWTTINTGDTNVVNGVLGVWDTSQLERCGYLIRLRVIEDVIVGGCNRQFRETRARVAVLVTCDGDVNNDGVVNIADLNEVLANFDSICDP